MFSLSLLINVPLIKSCLTFFYYLGCVVFKMFNHIRKAKRAHFVFSPSCGLIQKAEF